MIAGTLEIQLLADVARLRKDMSEAKGHVSQATKEIEKSAQLAMNALRSIGAGLAIREVIKYSDQWKLVNNQLKQVTQSEADLQRVRAQLFAVSKSANSELTNTTNLYAELYRATRSLNESEEDVVGVTKTINNLFLAGGKPASETAGAIRQLTQGLAAGALRGDEFNSVAEGAPRILDAIARSTGKTTGELRAFAATGGITSQILVKALKEYEDEAQRLADLTERSFGQKMVNATTNLTKFIGESDVASGPVMVLGDSIEYLSENLDEVLLVGEAVAAVIGTRMVASIASSTAATLKLIIAEQSAVGADREKTASTLALANADLVAARAAAARTPGFYLNAQAMAALTGAETAATAATNAHAAAMAKSITVGSVLRSGMALIGGPAGVITIAALAVYSFREELGLVPYNADAAAAAIDRFASGLDGLTAAQVEWNKAQLTEKMSEAEKGVERAAAQVAHFQSVIEKGMPSAKAYALKEMVEAQANLDAATGALQSMRVKIVTLDEAIAKANFVGPLREIKDGAVAVTVASGGLNDKTKEYLSTLQTQVDRLGMTERAVYLLEAADKAGAEASVTQRAEAKRLAEILYDKKSALEKSTEAAKAAKKAEDDLRKSLTDQSTSVVKLIGDYRTKIQMLGATARQQEIYNASVTAGEGATIQARIAVMALAGVYYDQAEATRIAEKATEDHKRATEQATEAAQRQWENSRDSLKEYILEFDNLGDTFERVVKDMAAEWAASGLMNLFGMKAPLTSGMTTGTGNGLMGSLVNAGLGSLLKGAPGSASFVGPVAPGAGAGIGGTISSAIGAIPGWGWAAMGVAAAAALFNNDDGYKRSNAGLLTAPTPGAKSQYTFDVEQFASGFAPTGFARREDQAVAEKFIETLRGFDQTFVDSVEKLGGIVSVTTLNGLNQEATPGSQGTFLGGGRDANITQQINWFVDQLADHTAGLEQSLLDAVRAATSADEALAILERAIQDKAVTDKDAAAVSETLRKAEEKLLKDRIGGIQSLTSEMQSVISLQRSIQMDVYKAMGATPLFNADASAAAQIAFLSEQRDAILRNHELEMRTKQQEYDQAIALAGAYKNYTNGLRLGDMSNLSSAGKFDFAQQNFRALAEAAQGGDQSALKSLQAAAESYVTQADSMFASSSGRKDVVSEVLAVMDSLQADLASSTFDPSAANQALIDQLSALDAQLAQISVGINNSIIAELRNINVTLSDLSPNMQESLLGAIGQWVQTSTPEGQGIIDALSGIRASVDVLPPEIAQYLTATMGAFLSANGNMQRTVEGLATGSVPQSAGQNYLTGQGFNLDYSASDITDRVSQIRDQAASEIEYFRQVGLEAIAGGVSSKQLADVLGYSQADILAAAAAAGLPMFAGGGYHSGGWRMVGERGPELEYTGPSRIFNNADSMQMMSRAANDDVVAELRELRKENQAINEKLAELTRISFADAQNSSNQMAKNNQALEKIAGNTTSRSDGVGSRRYASGS